MRGIIIISILLISTSSVRATELSDIDIKTLLIQESVSSYPGNCPCPYFKDKAGRSCGRRSAYSRPKGYSPICYPSDVTEVMIRKYRAIHQPKR